MSNNTAFELAPFFDNASFIRYTDALRDQGYTHVPVLRQTLADLDTPVSTYLKLANQPYTYLFESVEGGDKWGRYSIIGLPCKTCFCITGQQICVLENGKPISRQTNRDPLDDINRLRQQYRVANYPGLPEMMGGLVGYFGYESVAYIEPRLAKSGKSDPLDTPDIMLMLSEEVLVFDNLSGRIYLLCLADLSEPEAYDRAQQKLDTIENNLRTTQLGNHTKSMSKSSNHAPTVHFQQADFEAAVAQCKDYIRDGDIMQVVLSQRVSKPFSGRAIDVYRALRTINPSPYMYFLNLGDFEIVGSSPEILVRLENERVTVRPIAGTRQRGDSQEQDLALEKELLADQKERAEHVMLIDLGRNDLGRIAQIGTVKLTERMQVERYSHVMHIVSNVEGKLRSGLDCIDVLRATFPAGTVSGASKVRAMEIIHELEPLKRGVYSGAIGYIGWQGNMDTAIAIRTAVIKDGQLNIQAGAGIVADSDPHSEWQETMNKAKVVFEAAEMANNQLGVSHRC